MSSSGNSKSNAEFKECDESAMTLAIDEENVTKDSIEQNIDDDSREENTNRDDSGTIFSSNKNVSSDADNENDNSQKKENPKSERLVAGKNQETGTIGADFIPTKEKMDCTQNLNYELKIDAVDKDDSVTSHEHSTSEEERAESTKLSDTSDNGIERIRITSFINGNNDSRSERTISSELIREQSLNSEGMAAAAVVLDEDDLSIVDHVDMKGSLLHQTLIYKETDDSKVEIQDLTLARPGAVRVPGISVSETDNTDSESINISSTQEQISMELTRGRHDNRLRESFAAGSILVEAEAVSGEDHGVIVEAKPDPWWRRNQYWIALVVVIILSIVIFVSLHLTRPNEATPDPPTLSPTSFKEGVEYSVQKVILDQYPESISSIISESSPQSRAVQWISEQVINVQSPSWYTNQRILQQYALVALFFSASNDPNKGISWNEKEGWLESLDECEWYGVSCASDDVTITALNLTNNNIAGSLPPEISILSSSLVSLAVNNNHLRGSIPTEVGQLTKLTELDLSVNDFSGSIPDQLGEAERLGYLNLSENSLESTIPVEIGKLQQLQYVNLGNNGLVGSIPSEIGMLQTVEEINFENNKLSYALPSDIGILTALERLHLQGNQLLGPLPSEIGSLKSLEVVDLSKNYIFASIPASYWQERGLPSLVHFDLSNNLLTGSLPHDFGGSWQKLTTLRLGGRNFLRGNLSPNPTSFLNLPFLKELDLSSNFFTGTLPPNLYQMSSLESLDLSDNELSGTVLPDLYNLHDLYFLDISQNADLSGTLPSSIGKLTTLKTLGISALSGSFPEELWSLTSLEALRVINSELSGTLPSEIGLLSSLTELAVSGNVLLQGSIPSEIGTLLHLERINFIKNQELGGSIPSEFGLLPLTIMDISDNGFIEGAIPSEIGLLGSLRWLSLINNDLSGTISSYIGNLSSLKTFRIYANRLTGIVPTEVGNLNSLENLQFGANLFTGTIPSELGKLVHAKHFSLRFNLLTGTIPSELGNLRSLSLLNLWALPISGSVSDSLCNLIPKPTILVDCPEVVCTCCNCPEYSPSAYPTLSPFPTITPSPSDVHSFYPSQEPSVSNLPSFPSEVLLVSNEGICSPYRSISSFGTLMTTFNEEGECLVSLPFPLKFSNEGKNYTKILIGKSGRIIMEDDTPSCFYAIVPALSFTKRRGKDFTGPIYTFSAYDSFIISWEGAIPLEGDEGNHVVNFQTVLYATGQIEFRWGDGTFPVTHRVLSTVANTCAQKYANPSGDPFSVLYGPMIFPEFGEWPGNQCRLFQPDEEFDFYREVEP